MFDFILENGKNIGSLSAILFCLTIFPGIYRRLLLFKLNKYLTLLVQFITKYRSQFGIATYLAALLHYFIVRIYPLGVLAFTVPLLNFELLGFLSLVLLTPLFLTSNKISKKILKKNWKKLHKLVYIIVWLIFLHIAVYHVVTFKTIDIISAVVFVTAVLETYSLVLEKIRSKKKLA